VKRLVILGSTGSIGCQMLDIVRSRHELQVVGLAGGRNLDLLARQVREFAPRLVSFNVEGNVPGLRGPEICTMEQMVATPEADLVLVGTVGKAGLGATLAALRAGKTVALANKEVLVMAGELVQATAAKHGATLLPVDSEHSAIWQCLLGEDVSTALGRSQIRRLLLTASGGAFRDLAMDQLDRVTPEQALQHPTWKMGPKITVDSATLMNKGFEVIEAQWLFGCAPDQIEVVMHRESIVHSLVEFPDGTVKAQLGMPDMRVPLQFALTYPERYPVDGLFMDFTKVTGLTFERMDQGRYPCLTLALEATKRGGTYPAVLSAADEVAVARFLGGGCSFLDIHRVVQETLERHTPVSHPTIEDILEADAWARRYLSNRTRAQ